MTDIFGLLKGNSGDSDFENKGVIVLFLDAEISVL